MNQMLLEMLPWYVNGTLSPEDRRFVELHLDDEPIHRQQLEFYQAIQNEIRQGVPQTAPDLGLSKALERIRQLRSSKENSEGMGTRLTNWFQALLGPGPVWRPAFVLGIAALATQTVVIGYLSMDRHDNFSEVRARQNAPPGVGPFIKVSFRPDAKESDIRFLMIQLGASIVGGPSQLGDYYLFLKPDRTDWASQQLRKSPIVDSVTVTAILPAIKE